MLVWSIPRFIFRNLEDILRAPNRRDFIMRLFEDNTPYQTKEVVEHSYLLYTDATSVVINIIEGYLYRGIIAGINVDGLISLNDTLALVGLVINDELPAIKVALDHKKIQKWSNIIRNTEYKIMKEDLFNNEQEILFESTPPSLTPINYKNEVIEVLKANPKGLHVNEITQIISDNLNLPESEVLKKVQSICATNAKNKNSDITRVLDAKTNKPKKGRYRVIIRKPLGTPKITPTNQPSSTMGNGAAQSKMMTTFIGKAGECAVMSELLWRDYNVNTFLVDDGVDVVASKNNMFYLLQIKTTVLSGDKVSIRLNKVRFATFVGFNIRYVIVVRSCINNIDTNLFFIFNTNDIDRFEAQKRIKTPADGFINIKIKFVNNIPYIYDVEEEDISFYMNKWVL